MSDDVIGDETIQMTPLDWLMALGFGLIIAVWIWVLGMMAWSGIEWVISL